MVVFLVGASKLGMQQKSPQSGADLACDEQVRVLQLAIQKEFISNGNAVTPKTMRLRHIISYHVAITWIYKMHLSSVTLQNASLTESLSIKWAPD